MEILHEIFIYLYMFFFNYFINTNQTQIVPGPNQRTTQINYLKLDGMQKFIIKIKKKIKNTGYYKLTLVIDNNPKVDVEFVGDVSLKLDSDFELILKDVLNVPSFRRNLISASILDKLGYTFEIRL